MDERLRMRTGGGVITNRRETRSETHHRYPGTVITDNRRDTRSEPHRGGILWSSPPLQANPKRIPSPQQQFRPTVVTGATATTTSRRDSPSQPRSRRSDDQVPGRRPLIDSSADHKRNVVADPRRNEEARTHVSLRIREPPAPREMEEQRERADERRERCYKYSQKALGFAICTFFPYLTTASSSSAAGNTARKFSMAAFFVAVCADFFSWRRNKRRDGRVLVYLSSSSLMLMTLLMFISFDSYYACALPIVPLIIGAGLAQHKLRSGRQQNTDDDELLSDIFDFSALILNGAGFIAVFATAAMHSFSSSVANEHTEFSFVGLMLLSTVILSIYLMMTTTVRASPLTLHVTHLYYILQLLLLIMVSVFITNKMKA